MNFPDTLRYTEEHEWVRLDDDGTTATIGITDFAQSELGDIVFVEFPALGDVFAQGEEFGSVEAVKAVSELYMPVSGSVAAINDALDDTPELVNSDPYEAGWMIKVELSNPGELDGLLSAAQYQEMVG